MIQRVNPLEDADWDATVKTYPSASFFHSAAWARVLHETYGYAPAYLRDDEGESQPAFLPLMEVDSWLTGRRGISLPFTDDCGALGADAGSFQRLYQAALALARTRGWKYLELRGDRQFLAEAPASESYFGHTLALHPDEAKLFAGVDDSGRRAVRKAEASGLAVTFSQDPEAMTAFYGLLCRTRQRHGLPPQPFRFFQTIHRHVIAQNLGTVALARLGDEPVAGAVFFHHGSNVIYKFGASNDRFQHLRGNNLVMWRAIARFARNGFTSLDFGRTSLCNRGLRQFKGGWGTTEHCIDYVRFDCRSAQFRRSEDRSSGWHTKVFNALPSFVSRPIGATLYRHIA